MNDTIVVHMPHRYALIHDLGFCGLNHLFVSLIRPSLLTSILPSAALVGLCEFFFGLKPLVLLAFVILLTVELGSGIAASWLEGKRITSRRMKAFIVMVTIWMFILFIINMFRFQFLEHWIGAIFDYLFVVVILYANTIYFTSIWENMGRISQNRNRFKEISNHFSNKLKPKT